MHPTPPRRWAAALPRLVPLLALGVVLDIGTPHGLSAQAAPFSPGGTYALRLLVGRDTVPFQVVIAESTGRWGGQFIGAAGRARPLLAVVPQVDSSRVIVQYVDGTGFATMLLRVHADSVRGATEYADGTFRIFGVRVPTREAAGAANTSSSTRGPR